MKNTAIAAFLFLAALAAATPVRAEKPPKQGQVMRYLVVLADDGANAEKIAFEIAKQVDGTIHGVWHEPGKRAGGQRFSIDMTADDAKSLHKDKRIAMVMRDKEKGIKRNSSSSSLNVAADGAREVGPSFHEDNEWHWTVWYYYDGSGNVMSARESSFTYDPVGRLSTAFVVFGGEQSYAYDSFNNLTRININWPESYERLIPADIETNRLVNGQYDGGGNLTHWSGVSYGYDGVDMMKTLQSSTRNLAYLYTADDERIAMIDQINHRTSWRLRGFADNVLTEYVQSRAGGQSQWTWNKDYIYRDKSHLAAVTERGTDHFHLDHLDSTYWISDEGGAYHAIHNYMPYGEEGSSILQNNEALKFTGHERDYLGSGLTEDLDYLDYMHARYYFPAIGRFNSVDRMDPDFFNPRTMNLYSYGDGNPLARVDWTGQGTKYFTFTFRKEEFSDPRTTAYLEYNFVVLHIDKRTATRDKFAKGLADPEGETYYIGHMDPATGRLKFNIPKATAFEDVTGLTNNNRLLCIAACNSAAYLGQFKLKPGQSVIGVTSNLTKGKQAGYVVAGDLQYIATQIAHKRAQGIPLPQIVKELNDYFTERAKKNPAYHVKVELRTEPVKPAGDEKKKDDKKKKP